MRNESLTCLQPTAIQLTFTTPASPCSAPGNCLTQVVQTLLTQPQCAQVTNTPGAVPETDCSSGSGSTCRCFNQLEKGTRCLNIAKQLDAFPFLDFFHTPQQEFRPEVKSDTSIPPTQTPLSTWLRWKNLV